MSKQYKSWREIARGVIERTAAACAAEGLSEEETLKRIDGAYPFGERAYHPYKMWLDERKRWCTKQPQGAADARKAEEHARERAMLAAWNSGEPKR